MTDRGTPLYLEDLEVGRRFSSGAAEVDRDAVLDFAGQFDPQPFHLDEKLAKASVFKGLAASGWHTASLTMGLIVGSVPLAGGVVGLSVDVTWPAATRPGDVLRVDSEVLKIEPGKRTGVAVLRSLTRNQRDEIVQEMTARLLVRRRDETMR